MKYGMRTRLLGSTIISGLFMAAATPVMAQTQDTDTDGGVEVPTGESTLGGDAGEASIAEVQTGGIVVTGSRIRRPEIEGVSPVTVVDAEQIELTGTVTLESLINDLPNVIPGNNRTSNNSGGEGFSTLDLRGLGPNRTLILVDGERLPASSTTGVTDISQIPTALIQRIDVVTGGATAVYGSDAISGVINFVLKDDFEGLELTGQTSIAEAGVGFAYNVQGVFGGNFADGDGNVTVSASYYNREGVSQGRFDYSRISGALGLNDDNELIVVDDPSDLGSTGTILFPGGSATNPFGTVVNSAANPFRNLSTTVGGNFVGADNDCNSATAGVNVNSGSITFDNNGNIRPSPSTAAGRGFCGIPVGNSGQYNFAPNNLLSIPFDRLNLATTARYEFSEDTRAKLYATYVRTESTVNLAPTPAAGGTGFLIPVTSPFIPADLAAALATRPDPTAPFQFNRRFGETGPRIGINENNSFQIRGMLEHDLSADWTVSAVASYGRTDFDSQGIGNINRTAIEAGLNGCATVPGAPAGTGVPQGCVPVNIFGINALTPAMVNFIQTDTIDTSSFDQIRTAVNLTGSLFELVPGNPVGIALGAEYRRDRGESTPDDAKVRGEIIGFNQANPLAGEISVKEVYGEIRVPVLGGSGFPELLAFEAGARYSDYSSVGSLFNYKLAAEFAPFDFIRFRAAYNKAARAPSVFELFQNGDQGFPAVNDPCNATNATRNQAQCVAQGVPLSAFPTFQQDNSQVQAFAFGNPDLQEENAETYTIGAVFSPRSFPLGRFSATVDYYNITINNLNQAQGAQFFLSQCYGTQLDAFACSRIVRDPTTGQIQSVNTTRVNSEDPLKTSGIDAGLNWTIPLDQFFQSSDARLRISNLFTWVDKYILGGTDFVDLAFEGIGGITSEFANTLTVAYDDGPFTIQGRYVYKSGGDQSGTLFGPDDDTGFTTFRVPDLHSVDLSARANVTENFNITLIVENLLNNFPEQTGSGTFEQANTNTSFFEPYILGRSYTVQAQVRF